MTAMVGLLARLRALGRAVPVVAGLFVMLPCTSHAQEPAYTLAIRDHRFEPSEIEIPPGKKVARRAKSRSHPGAVRQHATAAGEASYNLVGSKGQDLAPKRFISEPADRRLAGVMLTLSRSVSTAAVEPNRKFWCRLVSSICGNNRSIPGRHGFTASGAVSGRGTTEAR